MNTRRVHNVGVAILATLMLLLAGSVALAADGDVVDSPGALINAVISGSPAAEARLVRGDIILALGDEAIASGADLAQQVGDSGPGDVVALTVLHGDDQYTVDVELGEKDGRPYLGVYLAPDVMPEIAPEPESDSEEEPGAEMESESDEEPRTWQAPKAYGMLPYTDTAAGAVVVDVADESPAQEAGIEIGDVILGVDDERLTQADDLANRIAGQKPGDEVTLEILRRTGDLEDVAVILGEHPDDAEKAFLGIQYVPTPRRMFLGHAQDGDLLVPPMPYFHHRPYPGEPPSWGPNVPPRSHRWLPYGFPMPHGGDMPHWGWDDNDRDDDEEEHSDQPDSDESPESDGSDNAGFPVMPLAPAIELQRL